MNHDCSMIHDVQIHMCKGNWYVTINNGHFIHIRLPSSAIKHIHVKNDIYKFSHTCFSMYNNKIKISWSKYIQKSWLFKANKFQLHPMDFFIKKLRFGNKI